MGAKYLCQIYFSNTIYRILENWGRLLSQYDQEEDEFLNHTDADSECESLTKPLKVSTSNWYDVIQDLQQDKKFKQNLSVWYMMATISWVEYCENM